jgi:hypothetical protein
MTDEIERLAHMLYLADLDYDGSGDKYGHLARSVISQIEFDRTGESKAAYGVFLHQHSEILE